MLRIVLQLAAAAGLSVGVWTTWGAVTAILRGLKTTTRFQRRLAASIFPTFALAAVIGLNVPTLAASDDSTDWSAHFQSPPVWAHPQIWWHWMNGNVTRAGITADLEAMHRIGIAEANIITVASSIPPGPVPVMSPQFFDMVEFAAKEAKRVSMTLCIDNCPGWSSSGGPWVTPDRAMQFLTTSETTVHGPMRFSGNLAQPPTKDDYYKDVAVLAFTTPAGEIESPDAKDAPTITTSVPNVDPTPLIKPGSRATVTLPVPGRGHEYFVQLEYPEAITRSTLIFVAGPMREAKGMVLTSGDGTTFHNLCPFTIPRNPSGPVGISLGSQPVSAKYFRLQFNRSAGGSTGVTLKGIDFSNRVLTPNISAKAGYQPEEVNPLTVEADEQRVVPADAVVHRDGEVDLTASLKPDGSLTWDVPPGDWTILRIGHTPTGVNNHPAPPEATGLECDKLSRAGLDASWNGMMQPLLDRLGPLAGTILDHSLIDSYEVGGQNWTPLMAAEFQNRRGYDPTPFLPAVTGRIVDSPQATERFLWDLRRTISDLMADNYFDYFTQLCHEHGLGSMIEPYTGPFESLRAGARNDIPMGEFWAGTDADPSIKLASSVGHTYGQNIIAAESLTGMPVHGGWIDDPYSLKAKGDLAFCAGINRFVFHRFAHQPWLDKFPGMTMGKWGINLDRTNTWFEEAGPWITYLTRCQYLLQQGKPANDIAYFCGQSAPVLTRAGDDPAGYADDSINSDVLLHKASVKDHRLLLEDGVSYALLVLPESDPQMTPELLNKLHDLVNDGLTILGPRPQHSPSLEDFPRCDEQVKSLASDMWGDIDGKTVTEHRLGQGKVVFGQTVAAALAGLNIAPDFMADSGKAGARFNFIHRAGDQGDIYFVANHDPVAVQADCTFRVAGRIPQIWHPDTGAIERASVYTARDGATTLPIHFDPTGSVFVIFRGSDAGTDPLATQPHNTEAYSLQNAPDSALELLAWQSGDYSFTSRSGRTLRAQVPNVPQPVRVGGPWQVTFPPHWGAPSQTTFDKLISWPDCADNGLKYFSGTATYTKQLDIPGNFLTEHQQLYLSLGTVKNLADVWLNGKDLGILWKPPFELDITTVAHAGGNDLQIKVTNLWPNRLIGDEHLPADVDWTAGGGLARWPQWLLDGKSSLTGRITFTTWRHVTKDSPLLPSGLLGPVELRPAALVPLQ